MRNVTSIEKTLTQNVKFVCSSIMNELHVDLCAYTLKFLPASRYQYMFKLDR